VVASGPDPKVPVEGCIAFLATREDPLLTLRGSGRMTRAYTVTQGGSVDLGTFFGTIQTVDLLLALYFMGFFVLGFAQGTIRRLIGIGSILFSFLLAANLAEPVGGFLATNWTHLPKEYSQMVGFATIFVAASLAFAIVVQGFYRPQPLFEKARFVDEILGGLLGLLQAAIILGAVVIILDSFFRLSGIAQDPDEIDFLRNLWVFLDGSQIVEFFRTTLIPAFFVLFGLFIPSDIKQMYPGGAS
jgi:membrane protein required for colicin V production